MKNLYDFANESIENMSLVIDKLFEKLNKVKAMWNYILWLYML